MNNNTLYNNLFISVMLVTAIAGYDMAHSTKVVPILAAETTIPTTAPVVVREAPDTVEGYIVKVFGEYAPKAMLLLKGDEVCGGENKQLDPKAVNVNKDGSKDYSIFQINDRYHPVYQLSLDTNWKANVDYAKRMFDKDGQTFVKRWVAGKCLARQGYDI